MYQECNGAAGYLDRKVRDFRLGSMEALLLEEPPAGLLDILANNLNDRFASRLISSSSGMLESVGLMAANSSITVV